MATRSHTKSHRKTKNEEPGLLSRILNFGFDDTHIVQAIKEDHDTLRKLIKVLTDEKLSLPEKRKAYKDFSSLLKSHSAAEEQVVYARTVVIDEMKEETYECEVEHKICEALMERIEKTTKVDLWKAEVKVLTELVEHHAQEEEREYLPMLEEKFAVAQQERMTQDFLDLRQRTQKNITPDNAGILGNL